MKFDIFSPRIPTAFRSLEHSVELGLVIGKNGSNITRSNAMDFIGGYTLALDMVAREFLVYFVNFWFKFGISFILKNTEAAETLLQGFETAVEYTGHFTVDEVLSKGFDTSCPVSGISR